MGINSTCLLCQCQIKENTIFFDLTDEQLDCFKNVIKNSAYRKKETIYLEDEPCTGLYVIRTGRIKLIRSSRGGKEQILKILQAGEIFGMEVFHEGKYTVKVGDQNGRMKKFTGVESFPPDVRKQVRVEF